MRFSEIRVWCQSIDDVEEAFLMGKIDPETQEIMMAIIKRCNPCAIAISDDDFLIFKDISEELKNPPSD